MREQDILVKILDELANIRATMITKPDLVNTENSIRTDFKAALDNTENSLRDELKKTERELRVLIENGPEKVAKLLREDYGRVADAAAKGAAAAEELEEVKNCVLNHDHALLNHNERLSALEQHAI